jgi:uncharacterized protein
MAKGEALRSAVNSNTKVGSNNKKSWNEMATPIDPARALETIVVCGKALIADSSGALYWPDERTLVVADLHLEKGTSRAASGTLLPPYDSQATLMKLAEMIDKYDPARVVALGDSLHDAQAANRIGKENLAAIAIMQEGRDWFWVAGNHDPQIPAMLGGTPAQDLRISGLMLRHEPLVGPATHEIAAHLHPAARLSTHGMAIRRPCFVSNGRRLVMPAFGAYTGGLNILDDAFQPLFGGDGLQVWMLGHDGAYPVAARRLRGE